MAEYIEREAIKKALLGWDYDPSDDDIEFAINEIPAADVNTIINSLKSENDKLKKELTILRDYIHFNNLEYDVMGYYGGSDTE